MSKQPLITQPIESPKQSTSTHPSTSLNPQTLDAEAILPPKPAPDKTPPREMVAAPILSTARSIDAADSSAPPHTKIITEFIDEPEPTTPPTITTEFID